MFLILIIVSLVVHIVSATTDVRRHLIPLTTEDYGPRALGLAHILLDGIGRTTITWVLIFIVDIPGLQWTTAPEGVGLGMTHPGYLKQLPSSCLAHNILGRLMIINDP
jgi:hypothetical protein